MCSVGKPPISDKRSANVRYGYVSVSLGQQITSGSACGRMGLSGEVSVRLGVK